MKRIFAIAVVLAASLMVRLAAEPPSEKPQDTRSETTKDRKALNLMECPFSEIAIEDFRDCPPAVQSEIKAIESMLDQGSNEEALARAERLVAANPNLAMVYATRSSCHHRQRRERPRIEDLDRAVALSPSAALRFARACYLCDRGRTAEGMQELKPLLSEGDRLPVATQLSKAHAALGELAEAEKYAQMAIELRPLDPAGHSAMCDVNFLRGRGEPALSDASRALELDPSSSWAWGRRAFIRAEMLHDYEAAAADFAEALARQTPSTGRSSFSKWHSLNTSGNAMTRRFSIGRRPSIAIQPFSGTARSGLRLIGKCKSRRRR